MVTLTRYFDPRQGSDFNWDNNINWHIYEDRERAKGPQAGGAFSGLKDDSSEFRIRIAKAKALDKARRSLLTAIHEKEHESFYSSTTSFPSEIKRTVDGAEKKTSEIVF